ncbi:unnamed protein product [Sphagnum jensenii]|uniref:Serine/threonine-protein phosphatase 2A activator n=1 Tax=Sphagnum jensenii TaxID=128206 RepID=A0ABP0VAC6_9BRYO
MARLLSQSQRLRGRVCCSGYLPRVDVGAPAQSREDTMEAFAAEEEAASGKGSTTTGDVAQPTPNTNASASVLFSAMSSPRVRANSIRRSNSSSASMLMKQKLESSLMRFLRALIRNPEEHFDDGSLKTAISSSDHFIHFGANQISKKSLNVIESFLEQSFDHARAKTEQEKEVVQAFQFETARSNYQKTMLTGAEESVIGAKRSDEYVVNEYVLKFSEFMGKLKNIVNDIPPLQQPMRYGNKAFRDWHARLEIETDIFLRDLLPASLHPAIIELSAYLNQSFGNETRIDYGTGHELSGVLFFLCLHKLGLLRRKDLKGLVLHGFFSYIDCMRTLQSTYMLEPAGSHGVWGLDDYHCLSFLFGAAQLVGHPSISPSSIHDPKVLSDYAAEYLYLEGIQYIKKIKSRAPFSETSPMLNDISGLPDWQKVLNGLLRLFQGEVLAKRPVCQHIPFGGLLCCTWIPNRQHTSHGRPSLSASSVSSPHFEAQTRAPWAKI